MTGWNSTQKGIKGAEEGDDKMVRATIHNKGILITNVYISNNKRYRGNRNLLTIGDFNMSLSSKTARVDSKDTRDQKT